MSRILVLDDEQAIGRAMRWELKGFEVEVASSISEALTALCRTQFDAVICDWNLGRHETSQCVLEAAAKLQRSSRRFIVSGFVPDSLAPLLVSGVAHRYIAKPWTPRDVRAAVTEELEQGSPRSHM